MIQSSEFRIGNYVDFDGEECQVLEISESGLVLRFPDGEKEWIDSFQLYPILLTEQMLLDCGFHHREFSFEKGKFFLSKRTGKKEFLYQAHTNRFQVKYLHQLQTLYFAVTSEELIYKQK